MGQLSPGMTLPSSADVYGVALLAACVSMVCAVLLLELLERVAAMTVPQTLLALRVNSAQARIQHLI